jgi:hypothetical protein
VEVEVRLTVAVVEGEAPTDRLAVGVCEAVAE